MKTIASRSIELALKLGAYFSVTVLDIETSFRELETEVRADERMKVLEKVRSAITVVAIMIGDRDPKCVAILNGLLEGFSDQAPTSARKEEA